MSRPQKIHKPLRGNFNNILAAVAAGTGKIKRAAEPVKDTVKASDKITRSKKS